MRICIPTKTNIGKEAKVSEHFGSAPYFVIYDTERDNVEVIDNPNLKHAHGACQPMSELSGRKIDTIICGGMGARAVQKLNDSGIKTYRASGGTVEEIIRQYEKGGRRYCQNAKNRNKQVKTNPLPPAVLLNVHLIFLHLKV